MKMKTDYDVTKNMLKTIRSITETKVLKQSINEVAEFESTLSDQSYVNGGIPSDMNAVIVPSDPCPHEVEYKL